MNEVKRTERGWPGHFCAASSCLFRRNTLLEYGDIRLVVSSVGNYRDSGGKLQPLGCAERMYETMMFRAKYDGTYWDADVKDEISLADSECERGVWGPLNHRSDQKANDVHEAVLDEISERLLSGEYKETK